MGETEIINLGFRAKNQAGLMASWHIMILALISASCFVKGVLCDVLSSTYHRFGSPNEGRFHQRARTKIVRRNQKRSDGGMAMQVSV